jgi:uncharacterized repeat protein (TIGR03803 family)
MTGTYTVLHTFTGGADGASPFLGVTESGGDRDLYGATVSGGTSGQGMVYKLDTAVGAYMVLYTVTGGTDGGNPLAGVILDSAGNLYGNY